MAYWQRLNKLPAMVIEDVGNTLRRSCQYFASKMGIAMQLTEEQRSESRCLCRKNFVNSGNRKSISKRKK